ncbi:hypothetical protein J1N35_041398, partial [Gossypium stocksii]
KGLADEFQSYIICILALEIKYYAPSKNYKFVMQFVWMSHVDSRIQEYASAKFLANRNIWHVKELDNLYKIDLWGRLEEDWPTFHKKYIKMW